MSRVRQCNAAIGNGNVTRGASPPGACYLPEIRHPLPFWPAPAGDAGAHPGRNANRQSADRDRGCLKRIDRPLDPRLEITEVCYRTLCAGGPALLFTHPGNSAIPMLGNLFGSTGRVALGMGMESPGQLRQVGELLAWFGPRNCPMVSATCSTSCRCCAACAT